MQLAASQTPSFSRFQFQSIGRSQSDNVPELLKPISSVDASASYDYDEKLCSSGQSLAEETPDVEMSESTSGPTVDLTLAAVSAITRRPLLMQPLAINSAYSSTVENSAPPKSKVDIFQKIDLCLPTASPESSASGVQRQVLRASSSRSSPDNLVYPPEPIPPSQVSQQDRSSITKTESSRGVSAIISPSLSLNENNSNIQSPSIQLVTPTPATRPLVLKEIHSRLEQSHSGSESSSISAKLSSGLELSLRAENLARKSQEFAQMASSAASASLKAATEARDASVQATALFREVKEAFETQEAKRIENLEGVKTLGEYILNREMIMQKRKDEKEANEKRDRAERERLVREEKKARSQAEEQIHIQDATGHPSSSISNLPANNGVPMAPPSATSTANSDIPAYLQPSILRALESIDDTPQQMLEDKRVKEEETQKDLTAEQNQQRQEQSRLRKVVEVERKPDEELKRVKNREEVAAEQRKALEVAQEQKRKTAVEAQQTRITRERDEKKAQLGQELAEIEEARKPAQDEKRRYDIVDQKLQGRDGSSGCASFSIGTVQSASSAASRGPNAVIDSPTLPFIATLPSQTSNSSQSPTIHFPVPLPASLPPKPRSTISGTVTTNAVANQVLIPSSNVQEQNLRSQKAKANARESKQATRDRVLSGNVSLGLASSNQAVPRNADVGVYSKMNPYPSKGTSSFAPATESEINDGASTSSSDDAPLLHSSSSHNTGNLFIHPKSGPNSTSPGVHASNVHLVTGPKQADKSVRSSAVHDGPEIKAEEDETNSLQLLTRSTSNRQTPSASASAFAPLPPQVVRSVPQPATFVPSPSVTQPAQNEALNRIEASRAGIPAPLKQPSEDTAPPSILTQSTPTATTVPPPPQATRTAQSTAAIVSPIVSSQHPRQKIPHANNPSSTSASSTAAPLEQPNVASTNFAPKSVPETRKLPVFQVSAQISAVSPPVTSPPLSNHFLPPAPSPISPDVNGGDENRINSRDRTRNKYNHYSPPRHSPSPRSYSPRSPNHSPSHVRTNSRSRSPGRYFSGSARSPKLSSTSTRRSFSPNTAPAGKNRKRPTPDNNRDLSPRKRKFSHQTDSGYNNVYLPTLPIPAADYMEPDISSYGLQPDLLLSYNDTALGARLSSPFSASNDNHPYLDSSICPLPRDQDHGYSDEQYQSYSFHQSHQLGSAKRPPVKRQRHSTNDQLKPELSARLGPKLKPKSISRGRGQTVRGHTRGGRGRG